jgi:hypothetical protein
MSASLPSLRRRRRSPWSYRLAQLTRQATTVPSICCRGRAAGPDPVESPFRSLEWGRLPLSLLPALQGGRNNDDWTPPL